MIQTLITNNQVTEVIKIQIIRGYINVKIYKHELSLLWKNVIYTQIIKEVYCIILTYR